MRTRACAPQVMGWLNVPDARAGNDARAACDSSEPRGSRDDSRLSALSQVATYISVSCAGLWVDSIGLQPASSGGKGCTVVDIWLDDLLPHWEKEYPRPMAHPRSPLTRPHTRRHSCWPPHTMPGTHTSMKRRGGEQSHRLAPASIR